MVTTTTHGSKQSTTPDTAQVEIILSQIESLPTLPVVATRLLQVTTAEDSDAHDVINLIESDQSLAARLLSAAAKANVGIAIKTVDRAVVLLGFDAVRSLVLSIQVFETFSHRVEAVSDRFDRIQFWKHSLAAGCAAQRLAEIRAHPTRRSDAPALRPEEAFVCGLLHDLGKVALDACFPKSYSRVIDKVEAWRGRIADEERAIFGVDHALVGRRLAMHWKLPAMIAECIWLHHHGPESTPTHIAYPEHVRIVQVADRLVRQMGIGYSGNYQFDGSASTAAAALGVSDETLGQVAATLPELIETRAAMIGLKQVTSQTVYQETLSRTNAELARVNVALAKTNRRLEQRSRCFDALCALNAGLSEDPTHEEVLRSAARAAGFMASGGPVAVLGVSRSRSLFVGVAWSEPEDAVRQEVWPLTLVDELARAFESGEGWLPVSKLPGPLTDRLTTLLGVAPGRCWPIRDRTCFYGAVVIASTTTVPADAGEMIRVLLDWIGSWLRTAEAASVSRRLSEELAEINRQLVCSQNEVTRVSSLAMVGEMAAGAAHELNNPLAVISGRAQLIGRSGENEKVCRSAEVIAENAHRASEIVNELMDFAKPSIPEPTVWPVARLFSEIRRQWIEKNVLSENQFQLHLSDETVKVHADESQMQMLFDEVIRNAVEAMRDSSEALLVINCRADPADDTIVIQVQDNGCGMNADVVEHAIDPFFSYRPAGRGRGLGLSRAARYAEINGGRIRLSSVAGEGTSVYVELSAGR